MIANRSLVRNNKSMPSLSFLFFIVSPPMVSVSCDVSSMDTVQRTLPAYALALKAETTLNSSTCGQELGIFRDAVDTRKWWALKMLDASGQPKSGFTYGNNFWFGSGLQCSNVANTKGFSVKEEFLRNMSIIRKGADEYPPYNLHYFMTYFRHNTTMKYDLGYRSSNVISLGLCVPASCTVDQLSSILEIIFRERTLMFSELYEADFQLLHVKDMQDDRAWLMTPGMIIVILIIAMTIILMIAGTAYDIFVYPKYLKAIEANNSKCNNEQNTLEDRNGNTDILETINTDAKPKEPSLFWQGVQCFSVPMNTKYIFTMKGGSGNIDCLDGMRFISMVWVLLTHSAFFMLDYMDNTAQFFNAAGKIHFQLMNNATFEIDNFFFISGFLMAYLNFKYYFVKNTKNKPITIKAKTNAFFTAIWNRFMRLTPAYMMAIGISEMIYASYSSTSVFSMKWEKPQDTCAKYWWRNLLYINNFFPRSEMCLSWSWYLSNDMQFFVLGNFLIILSTVYFYTAVTILGFIFVSSSIITGYTAYAIRYDPTMDTQFQTVETLYDPPWARIGPYIVGIVAAYILIKLNNKLTLRRIWIIGFWLLSIVCELSILFGLYRTHLSLITSAFYAAFSRSAWAIGVAWVIIACCTGNAGIINTFLSLKVWSPLSKLTYSTYLLHPLIMNVFYLQSEFPMHLELIANSVTFFGFSCISFILSYVFSMMIESPCARLMNLISKRGVKKR